MAKSSLKGPQGLPWSAHAFLILCHVVFIMFVLSPLPAAGNPLTKLQLGKVRKLLEDSIKIKYPSDAVDKFSDILIQAVHTVKNLTYYHAGNKEIPVFISFGLGNLGKKLHILLRGEDYLNPKDKNNFVVMMQMEKDPTQYAVHMAHVLDMKHIEKSKVVWNDGRVEQQPNMKKLLELMGNKEVQARSLRQQRPRCDWIGVLLLCESKKYVKPMRDRAVAEPLDTVNPAPIKLKINSEESAPSPPAAAAGAKNKRNINGVGNANQLAASKTSGGGKNVLDSSAEKGDGVEEEDEKVVFSPSQNKASTLPPILVPLSSSAPPSSSSAPSTTAPKKADLEDGSKRKHKRKSSKKPKREHGKRE